MIRLSFILLFLFFLTNNSVSNTADNVSDSITSFEKDSITSANTTALSELNIADISTISVEEENTFIKKTKSPYANTHMFFGFIILFIIIIYIRLVSPEYFRDLFLFAANGNYLLANYHKKNVILLINNILLDFIFIGSISILLYSLLNIKHSAHFELFFAGVAVFFIAQLIVILIGYNTFFDTSVFNIHISNILIFNRVLGIVLAPTLFIASYLKDSYQFTAFAILLVVVIAIFVFRIFRIYFLIKKSYQFNSIYIILYLCVFEISLYLLFIREFSWFIN